MKLLYSHHFQNCNTHAYSELLSLSLSQTEFGEELVTNTSMIGSIKVLHLHYFVNVVTLFYFNEELLIKARNNARQVQTVKC